MITKKQAVRQTGSGSEVPDDKTAFPIFKESTLQGNKALFFERTARSIGKCSSAVKDMIEACQPYHEGVRARSHPLWLIHELDIIDKHRTINIVGGNYRATWKKGGKIILAGIELEPEHMKEQGAFQDCIEVGEYTPEGELQSKFEPAIQITIGFGHQPGLFPGESARVAGSPSM